MDIFDSIIGHDAVKMNIKSSIEMGMFSHAHLIIGEDGIGKSLLARAIALKVLNKEIEKQYVDIIEFRVAKNKQSIGIREVVEDIIDEVNKKPYESDKKVIIIYEADKMTTDAQNAFLKTIEEPPRGVFVILLCSNSEAILETIKSRCQLHKLQRLNKHEMVLFLKRKYNNLTPEDLKPIVSFSDGIPGRAESFIEDDSLKELRDFAMRVMEDACGKITLQKYDSFLSKHKNDWNEVLTWFLSFIRDIMIYKETENEELIVNTDKIHKLKEMASMFSFNKLNGIIEIVNEIRRRLERNVNPEIVFNIMLLKMQDA